MRLLAALAAVLTLALAAQARADTVTDLGGLVPMGMNGSDQVVGDVVDSSGDSHAALWNSSLQMLRQLNSTDQSDAYAISAGGRIAGDDYASTSSVHGAYWNGGGLANQFGPFSGVPESTDDTVLNDVDTAGDLVGITPQSSTNLSITGFLFHSGAVMQVGQSDLDGQPGGTAVGAITPDGSQMLGSVETGSGTTYYLWSSANPFGPGTALDITAPTNGALFFDGAEFGTLIENDLASDGTVLGYKGAGTSKTFYIRLPNGTETQVGGLHLANAVNASHVVAGAIYGPSLSDPLHAAIWTNGAVTDLNTLLPPGSSGWDLTEATAINDNGDIAGIAEHYGQQVGFLLNTSASMSVKFGTIPQLQVGQVVDVPVTVTAGSVDLTSVSLGDGLSASGDAAKVEQQAAGIDGFSLSAGQSRTFAFKLKGLKEGNASLALSVTGASARGNATDSATATVKVWNPQVNVLRVKVPSNDQPSDAIDIQYRGMGWNPDGGPFSFRFSGLDAGTRDAAAIFDGTLKINRWPKRATDQGAIKDRAGGAECWGEFSVEQGGLFATTKASGRWAGWVLWSANPEIKAHEAFCEGEEYTFLEKSRQPIVVMGDFEVSRRLGLAVRVYGWNGPGTVSPAKILNFGPVLSYYDRSRDICVGVSLDRNADLITTATRGACS